MMIKIDYKRTDFLDQHAMKQVLGILVKDTTLLAKYPLTEKDFVNYEHDTKWDYNGAPTDKATIPYLTVFKAIKSAYESGKVRMETGDIEKAYQAYVKDWADKALSENFEHNYDTVRKMTVLREAQYHGYTVTKYVGANIAGSSERELLH